MGLRNVVAVAVVASMMPTWAMAQALRPETAFGRSLANWQPGSELLEGMVVVQAECGSSREKGRVDAGTRHGAAGWFLGGVGAGVGLGFIGTGVIAAASAIGSPQPRDVPAGVEDNCYRSGYSGKAKSKNVLSAFLGGLAGTGAWLAIYLANRDE